MEGPSEVCDRRLPHYVEETGSTLLEGPPCRPNREREGATRSSYRLEREERRPLTVILGRRDGRGRNLRFSAPGAKDPRSTRRWRTFARRGRDVRLFGQRLQAAGPAHGPRPSRYGSAARATWPPGRGNGNAVSLLPESIGDLREGGAAGGEDAPEEAHEEPRDDARHHQSGGERKAKTTSEKVAKSSCR